MTISSAASAINVPPDMGEARRNDTEQIKELLDRCLRERQFKEKHNRVEKNQRALHHRHRAAGKR
ncbi:MAG: hypothetical protein WA183_06785 [Chthoniobacterales bacterium]